MKVRNKTSSSKDAGLPAFPIRIAQAFYIPRPSLPVQTPDPPRESAVSEDLFSTVIPPVSGEKDRVTVLGIIRSADDTEYVYGKDIESGRIVTIQNGAAAPLISQWRESE
jgi:hypothetical protein